MRGETLDRDCALSLVAISIHSPHTRGDHQRTTRTQRRAHFNPLPSHEGRHHRRNTRHRHPYFNPLPSHEGRRVCDEVDLERGVFQSTPLMRGETLDHALDGARPKISIHSPHTRGDDFALVQAHVLRISIHSPHARGDPRLHAARQAWREFQSTPLMRGETFRVNFCKIISHISIHSPHARGDPKTERRK